MPAFFALAAISAVFAAALWLLRPSMLALLVWPILLLYPRNLLHGLLPFNAGLNHLFIIVLAARMLFYSNPQRHPSYRWGTPVVLIAVGMMLMQAAAELTGALRFDTPELWLYLFKSTALGVVFVATAIIFAKAIVSETDLKRHLAVFLLSMAVAFLLVWVCGQFESARHIWEDYGSRKWEKEFAEYEGTTTMRSWGPFDYTTGVGIMVAAVLPLAVGLSTAPRANWLRLLAILTLGATIVAQIVTKARSSLVGIALVLIGWILLSRWRFRILAVLLVFGSLAGIFAAATGQGAALADRFTSYRLTTDYQTRADTWYTIVTNPSPFILMFGEGGPATMLRLRVGPHNGFLDALFLWGVFGVGMFTLLYTLTVRWARLIIQADPSPIGRASGWGAAWSTLAIAGTALTLDPWYVSDYRFFVYFLLAVLWQRRESILVLTLYSSDPVSAQQDEPLYANPLHIR